MVMCLRQKLEDWKSDSAEEEEAANRCAKGAVDMEGEMEIEM